jgi:predicted NUDIX family phosphoesterase
MMMLPKKYAEEIILVCQRIALEPLLKNEGYIPADDEVWAGISAAFPMRRGDAEIDQSVIQLVSFFLVTNKGECLTHKRCKKQPEKRLIDVRAVGFSGHINESDSKDLFVRDLFEPTDSTPYVNRELSEEVSLSLNSKNPISFHGYIWEPSDDMGRQHIGLLYEVPCNGEFKILEPGLIADAHFDSLETVANSIDEYSSWSKIILSAIDNQKLILRRAK